MIKTALVTSKNFFEHDKSMEPYGYDYYKNPKFHEDYDDVTGIYSEIQENLPENVTSLAAFRKTKPKKKRYLGMPYGFGDKWGGWEVNADGLLLVKDGAEGIISDISLSKSCPKGYIWVDSARAKDIEVDLMREVNKEQAVQCISRLESLGGIADGSAKARSLWLQMAGILREKKGFIKDKSLLPVHVILHDRWVVLTEFQDKTYDFIKKLDQNLVVTMVDFEAEDDNDMPF